MSRHGYTDDNDDILQLGRWRGMVKSAIRGKRGQKLLRDLAAALDAMPEKRLIRGALQTSDGDCCAIGAVCAARGKDYRSHEHDDPCELEELNETLASELNVAKCLVQEVEYENDWNEREEPERRWQRMRQWVARHIKENP
jgi:hypothetical protein